MSRATPVAVASLLAAAAFWVASGGAWARPDDDSETTDGQPTTTYERFLPLAKAGDPDIQHFLGFMYFYGEGVELNYDKAHYWFHLAAEQGEVKSQRNLGIFHARLLPRIPKKYFAPEEANLWFSLAAAGAPRSDISGLASRSYGDFLAPDAERLLKQTEARHIGEKVFVTFCAGCHGFDGHAPHPIAPSFALRERLTKSDRVLVHSILNGLNLMPAWGEIITEELAYAAVAYIRRRLDPGPGGVSDSMRRLTPEELVAQYAGSELELGEKTYLQFCGGCHGFNGIAKYVNSPSFALQDRMEKSDEQLANAIRKGYGVMPSWENMLLPQQIDALVKFIRTLSLSYEAGIGSELRSTPELFFRFRPRGETGPEWTGADPAGS